jgi:hypothetical protein
MKFNDEDDENGNEEFEDGNESEYCEDEVSKSKPPKKSQRIKGV